MMRILSDDVECVALVDAVAEYLSVCVTIMIVLFQALHRRTVRIPDRRQSAARIRTGRTRQCRVENARGGVVTGWMECGWRLEQREVGRAAVIAVAAAYVPLSD
ncbi:hypothetical protein NDU88_001595 [Pleurodeles waltl]|uniref:Uncharacterized protein n=1 Tax=Pleurodeles waltl TaxID=8319 RepID=A0AAV7R7K3_PLEWA|nr:hypothetical protein NDU88_001595 [Pleurodeles waltl]